MTKDKEINSFKAKQILIELFLQGATDHHGTGLFRACSYKSSGENSLEYLEPRVRTMVSTPLFINVQEDAALITSQVWKHRQMCSIREGHVVHQLHFNDKEKMKQQRQMTCSKSLTQSCMWNQSLLLLLSLVLFTYPLPQCHTQL